LIDGDGIWNVYDSCPTGSNGFQQAQDTGGDLVGDACDNCRNTINQDQLDSDRDGIWQRLRLNTRPRGACSEPPRDRRSLSGPCRSPFQR
jgi:Thrombospondin type 3 repeat